MRNLLALILLAPALTACGPSTETRQEAPSSRAMTPVDPSAQAELVMWRDLLPDEELAALQALTDGTANPALMSRFTGEGLVDGQIGTFNVVEALDGMIVRIPGYILPLDFAERGAAREFLLLPYHGACVHYPPPPPNQIVYLRSQEPVRFDALWDPVWVEGRIEIERVDTDLAAAAYSMVLRSVSPYQP